MPSNFEMVAIALLIVNLVITLYFGYKNQENYTTTPPTTPVIKYAFSPGKITITTPMSADSAPIRSYEYSVNNGASWRSAVPDTITNNPTSNVATLSTPYGILFGDFQPGITIIVRVSNMNGSTRSNPLTITSAMVPVGAKGQTTR